MAYNQRYRTGLVDSSAHKRKWNPSWQKKGPVVERGSLYKPITSPTDQQLAIFDHIQNSSKSLRVIARAGTSKTSSIVHSMRQVSSDKSMLYVIFANRCAREAEAKTEERVCVKTVHAFGLAALRKAFGNKIEVDDKGDKSYNISIAQFGGEDEKAEVRHNFIKAMDLCKGYLAESVQEVLNVCDLHAIEYCGYNEADFAARVIEGLRLSALQYMRVEFSDMVWLPCKLGLAVQQYDIVFLDEAGDCNPARIEIVLKAIKSGGKLVFIGDPRQNVFQFTGSSADAMDVLQARTQADTLPLTMTFRCGKAIVELVKSIVPDYEAAPGNCEGVVESKTVQQMMAPVDQGGCGPGDFIISRTNAPLVPLCLQFIREGRRCMVLGKDLGKNLQWMLRRSKASSVAGFLDWLDNWKNVECEKLITRNKKCDHITDKYDTLVYLSEGTNDLETMRKRIDDMFSDDNVENIITATSGHKSKGMERKRVWKLEETFAKCSAKATTPTDIVAEENINYVSTTRAEQCLYLVS
jgi:DNA helicase-2/ATP-dependent DNA helicase PcrA